MIKSNDDETRGKMFLLKSFQIILWLDFVSPDCLSKLQTSVWWNFHSFFVNNKKCQRNSVCRKFKGKVSKIFEEFSLKENRGKNPGRQAIGSIENLCLFYLRRFNQSSREFIQCWFPCCCQFANLFVASRVAGWQCQVCDRRKQFARKSFSFVEGLPAKFFSSN